MGASDGVTEVSGFVACRVTCCSSQKFLPAKVLIEEPEEGLNTEEQSTHKAPKALPAVLPCTPTVGPVGRAGKIRDKDERGEEAREDRHEDAEDLESSQVGRHRRGLKRRAGAPQLIWW